MFDAKYFKTHLPAQIKSAGEGPTVEVYLLTGQSHRVRTVVDTADGYVVLEVHQRRAEVTGAKTPWEGGAPKPGGDTHHAIVSYDAITQVVIAPTESSATTRIGFGAA